MRNKAGAIANVMTCYLAVVNFQRHVKTTDKAAVLHPVAHPSKSLVMNQSKRLNSKLVGAGAQRVDTTESASNGSDDEQAKKELSTRYWTASCSTQVLAIPSVFLRTMLIA